MLYVLIPPSPALICEYVALLNSSAVIGFDLLQNKAYLF